MKRDKQGFIVLGTQSSLLHWHKTHQYIILLYPR